MLTATLTLLLGIIVILAIIAANGYFVTQEFAYMSVDRSRLRAMAEQGDAAAERALSVTERTSFMLSGAQLGITVTGLLIGYVAEPLVGESLSVLLDGAGVPAAVSISVGTVLALAVSTIVQMIFGELYPKNLAIAKAEPLARNLARSTNIYLMIFGWLIKFFDQSANKFLKLLRIEPVHDLDSSANARDLEYIVADSRDSGDLPKDLSILLDRILDFPQRNVEHAMTPRARANIVEPDITIGEVRSLMAKEHTRYPVVNSDDEPIGVVHLVDILSSSVNENDPVTTIMRPPLVVPTLMSLTEAQLQMSESKDDLACVIDEYGGFTGILTIEDLAEEVVGEISDEHDSEEGEVVEPEGEDSWQMSGDVHLDEAEREIGYQLPRGDFETIAGLLIANSGKLPDVNEEVTVELPEDPADLVEDEPVKRYLIAQIIEVDKWVPTMVSLTIEQRENDDESEQIRRDRDE
ncbi:hemolysin family protein [Jeotgalibacillus terrae]|uniref:Hemolysin family protein n=1 Tax=Jeotgalibacillus terrae TaxID=587735 RepID=A0ABW5ZIS9_9BACL|nr:hemolysin family protein [Jeotgalibacillus terrae]MBM7579967.1 CBS domain containing-hemolysin-like protein [Jeotgalibacillus terrae]